MKSTRTDRRRAAKSPWCLPLSLGYVRPRPWFDGSSPLPDGEYKARIIGTELMKFGPSDPRAPLVRLDCTVEDGKFKDTWFSAWLSAEIEAGSEFRDLEVRRNNETWKAFLLAIGAPAAMLDGPIKVATQTVTGKVGRVFVRGGRHAWLPAGMEAAVLDEPALDPDEVGDAVADAVCRLSGATNEEVRRIIAAAVAAAKAGGR